MHLKTDDPAPKTRKYLFLDSMVQEIHDCFSKVPDYRPNNREGKITLLDTLVSGFAMMHLKYPALLEFDKDRKTPEHFQGLLDDRYLLALDGTTKNDCERNALKRFLINTQREHLHLKLVILLDGLYADAPTIRMIKQFSWNFTITAKDDNHQSLIEAVDIEGQVNCPERTDEKGYRYSDCYVNGAPLNKSNPNVIVNVLDYIQIDKKGKQRTWSWVTDIQLTEDTVTEAAKGGRCRWRIENETFKTLKNQGYELEHNYGHGQQHLATNLAYLTFLAFMVNQIQQLCCSIFQLALKERAKGMRSYMWKLILRYFMSWIINDWDELFTSLVKGTKPTRIQPDTT